MDKIEFAQGLGEKIIKSQHDSFVLDGEDLSHITNLKRIIVSISDHLRSDGLPVDGVNSVAEHLKGLSKRLFLDTCLANKAEDEDEEEFMEESEIWFDYIYKHEKYPR